MTVQERRARENEEMRELILTAAGEIIAEKGIEGLSVRKLAARIDYSPAMIYHYFRDKEEIISFLMQKGYAGIVAAISSAQGGNPEQRLEEMVRKYIAAALAMPEVYKTVLLSSSQEVLQHTSALFRGAGESRRAIGMLCRCIEELRGETATGGVEVELTAQVIWTATFGLTIRLILEKGLPAEQRVALIERHIRVIVATAKM